MRNDLYQGISLQGMCGSLSTHKAPPERDEVRWPLFLAFTFAIFPISQMD